MKKILALLVGLTLAVITSSCESGGGGDGGGGGGNGADDLDISNSTTLDHNNLPAQNAAITRKLHFTKKVGGYAELGYDPLNWPKEGKVEGGVYIFWEDDNGNVQGGLFEFHGIGRTTVDLHNILPPKGNYFSGPRRPPNGAEIYFCIVNLKGTERTNVKKSENNW